MAPDSQGCFHPGPHVGTVVGMKRGHKRAEAAGGQTRSGNRPGQRGQRATSTGKAIFERSRGCTVRDPPKPGYIGWIQVRFDVDC